MAPIDGADARRVAGRLAAFRIVEEVQSREDAAADLSAAQAEARAEGWGEVERVLLYAASVRACWLDEPDALDRIEALLERSERDDDDLLRAAALATGAAHRHRLGISAGDADRSDGDLAVATALLDMPHGPALERVSAYISCASAYAERELWELEAEMYDQATTLLPRCEEPRSALVVRHNRPFTHLYASCSLHEVDEVDEAREQCRLGIAAAESALAAGLPDDYAASVRGVRYLLSAIADLPRPEPLTVILSDTLPLLHQHSVGSVHLAEAIRALRAADLVGAADHVGAAVPLLAFDPRSAELALALRIATQAGADGGPGSAAALRYGQHNARLRRQARLRLLGSARVRLETERLRIERDAYARQALEDQLTGVGNRHRYDRWLGQQRSAPSAGAIGALLVDVDQFKEINDTHGHGVGDDVLRRIAALLGASARPVDLVVRLGGDEFVLLLADVDEDGAHRLALELVTAIRSAPWREIAHGLRVRVSVGVVTGSAARAENLLRDADTALYVAKAGGRDRVAVGRPEVAVAPG